MADAAAPASTPAASDPGAGAPPAASAPDWVPADFAADWGTDSYAEKLSRAYAEKHAKLSTRTDDLRKQVAAEIEADRRRGLPEKPDGYTFRQIQKSRSCSPSTRSSWSMPSPMAS